MINVKKHSYNISLLSLILVALLGFNLIQSNIKDKITLDGSSQKTTLAPSLLKVMNLGLQRLMSSYLWTTTLLQSDVKHVKKGEISWLYYRLDAIAHLNPFFKENYQYGSLYLSVIHDDVNSSQSLLENGLIHFPKDEHLLWLAGFNLCFELNDCKGALKYFYELLKLPRNKYHSSLPSIIAKIENTNNNTLVAYEVLLKSYQQLEDGLLKEKTYVTLYSLKAKNDLNCLNNKLDNCDYIDFDGERYLFSNGVYSSIKKLEQRDLKLIHRKSRD